MTPRSLRRLPAFLGALLVVLGSPAQAQSDGSSNRSRWDLTRLHNGFCVQFLIEKASAVGKLPEGARPLRAAETPDLHPALRSAVEGQPEFAEWTPSHVCLFYFGEVAASGNRLREDEPRKMPLVGFWTVAARDQRSDARRDLVVEFFTNSGRLERWGRNSGLYLKSIRSEVTTAAPDEYGVPQEGERYRIKIGKTELIWMGRPGQDSTAPEQPATREWLARSRHGGQVRGMLTLTADWSRAMIGSLKVLGKDELARLLQASPIRFVGPSIHGGQGSLEFAR